MKIFNILSILILCSLLKNIHSMKSDKQSYKSEKPQQINLLKESSILYSFAMQIYEKTFIEYQTELKNLKLKEYIEKSNFYRSPKDGKLSIDNNGNVCIIYPFYNIARSNSSSSTSSSD